MSNPISFDAWEQAVKIARPMSADAQNSLYPKRVSTNYGKIVNGEHLAFVCEVAEGGIYYCKRDSALQQVRFTERFCTTLAAHLGIPTADHAVIEDSFGETYFGSLQHTSTLGDFELTHFLSTPQRDEIGAPSAWLGQHLSMIGAFDFVINNPDRDQRNFVLRREGSRLVLAAIDFGSAHLDKLSTCEFPVAPTRTSLLLKRLQNLHGRSESSAIEMVDRLAVVPVSVVERILTDVPDDWTNAAQKEGLCDAWSNGTMHNRLAELRAGIKNGTLL